MIIPLVFISVLLLLLYTSRGSIVNANAMDDWIMFHHDLTHTGSSTSLAPVINNTQWSYTTGSGGVESSFAIFGGKVYLSSIDRNVYCLDAVTGARVRAPRIGTTQQAVEAFLPLLLPVERYM